jgi:hypothetical protein
MFFKIRLSPFIKETFWKDKILFIQLTPFSKKFNILSTSTVYLKPSFHITFGFLLDQYNKDQTVSTLFAAAQYDFYSPT